MIVCAPCPPLSFHFGLGWGGIGATRRLCSSVIRMGGRESASQQDSLFYIHQKSCLWFAPSLTCDSMDCSTTMLLRKSCTYHPLFHTTLTPSTLFSLLFFLPAMPPPPPATHLLKSATVPPPPPAAEPSGQRTSLLISSLLLILLLSTNHQTFAKVIFAEGLPPLVSCTSRLEKRTDRLKRWRAHRQTVCPVVTKRQ